MKQSHGVSTKSRNSLKTRETLVSVLFAAPVVIFLVGFLVYPIIVNARLSVSETTAGTLLSGGDWIGLENFKEVFADPHFTRVLIQTLIFTVVSVIGQLALGLLVAVFFNQKFPGAQRMSGLFLIGWITPIVATGAIFRWLFDRQFGVLNWLLGTLGIGDGKIPWLTNGPLALLAVSIASIWMGLAFYVSYFTAALKNIPEQQYEAAMVDGAGPVRRFLSITLPNLRGAILIGAVFAIIFTLKAFDIIFIMTDGGPLGATDVLSTYGYNEFFNLLNFGKGSAVMNIMVIIMAGVSAIYLWINSRNSEES